MWFSVGVVELGMMIVILITAASLACLRLPAWRWAAVALACVTAAALISPADPMSTVVFGLVFMLFFVGGTRFGRSTTVGAA